MAGPQLRRISQLDSLTTPKTQLAGAYLVLDVPLGPVSGGYKTVRGTPEQLMEYLGGLAAYNANPSLRKSVEFRTKAERTASGYGPADASTMEELDPLSMCLGTEIYVANDPSGQHEYQVVYDNSGPLYVWVDGNFAQSPRQKISAKIVAAASDTSFLTGTYPIQAADLPAPAITVPDAVVFAQVGIEGAGGSLRPLAYGSDYTSSGNVLTILAAAGAQAGEVVHYRYLAGSAAAGYSDAQARAAQLGRVAPAGTTTILLDNAERPRDYGTAASGTFTVDGTNAVQDAGASFRLGTGAAAPVFQNAPSDKPFVLLGDSYAPGKAWGYSLLVLADEIQVLVYAH